MHGSAPWPMNENARNEVKPVDMIMIKWICGVKLNERNSRTEADEKFFNGMYNRNMITVCTTSCHLHVISTHNEIAVRKHVFRTIHKNKTVLFVYKFCPCKLCTMIVLLYIVDVHQ